MSSKGPSRTPIDRERLARCATLSLRAHESAQLCGVRVQSSAAVERKRAKLLAAGDTRGLYLLEREQRAKAVDNKVRAGRVKLMDEAKQQLDDLRCGQDGRPMKLGRPPSKAANAGKRLGPIKIIHQSD